MKGLLVASFWGFALGRGALGYSSRHEKEADSLRKLLTIHQSDAPFLEKDGLIVMEAESVPIVWPWVVENTVQNYTGLAYYRFNGNTVQKGPPNGTLSYKFYINTPGKPLSQLRGYLRVRFISISACITKQRIHSLQ